MKILNIEEIKINFAHELKKFRIHNGFTQQKLSQLLGCDVRTIRSYEDEANLNCSFSNSANKIRQFSKYSEHDFPTWIKKIFYPNSFSEQKKLFEWEKDILENLYKIPLNLRRMLSESIAKIPPKKYEKIILISVLLSRLSFEDLNEIIVFLANKKKAYLGLKKEHKTIVKIYVEKIIGHHFHKI